MSTTSEHVHAITCEHKRALELHPQSHSADTAASLILTHAMDVHQLAHNREPSHPADEEHKLLTQTAALCLKRLGQANLPTWYHESDPTPRGSPSADSR